MSFHSRVSRTNPGHKLLPAPQVSASLFLWRHLSVLPQTQSIWGILKEYCAFENIFSSVYWKCRFGDEYPYYWASQAVLVVKNLSTNAGERCWFHPWVRMIPWRRAWQPTPAFLPKEFHGQRSLVGYSPRGCKELDTTKSLTLLSCLASVHTSRRPEITYSGSSIVLRQNRSHTMRCPYCNGMSHLSTVPSFIFFALLILPVVFISP